MLIPSGARAAAVAPATIEVVGTRGGVAQATFSIINTSATEQTYYLGTMKFVPKEETGAPQFIPYEEDHSGLADWIKFQGSSVTVPANTKLEYPFLVNIPGAVDSGGYYSAITVSGSPQDLTQSNGAVVEAKTAILVFLTIEGQTNRKAEILDFNKESGFSSLSEDINYRIQNQGNVHVVPTGEVKIKGLFGRTIRIIEVTDEIGRVLPGSTRKYTLPAVKEQGFWNTVSHQMRYLAIGPVKAELNLSYSDDQPKIMSEISYFHFPAHLISVVLGGFIILLLLFRGLSKSKRK